MSKRKIAQIVDFISNVKQGKIPDDEIAKQLVSFGVPENETLKLIECVVNGFQSGVNAVVTGGLSAEDYTPGENQFYDLAFKRGKAAMRFTTPFWVLIKFLALFWLEGQSLQQSFGKCYADKSIETNCEKLRPLRSLHFSQSLVLGVMDLKTI